MTLQNFLNKMECGWPERHAGGEGVRALEFVDIYTHTHIYIYIYRERERETDRQTDRQTDREKDSDRDRDRQTDIITKWLK